MANNNLFPVYFNYVRLDNVAYVQFTKRFSHSIPTRAVNSKSLANDDGGKMVSADFNQREIIIDGTIIAPNRPAAELARDNLMQYLTPKEKPLKIDQGGFERVYTATMQNITFSEAQGGFIPFSINFICSDPFGYREQSTAIAMGAAITAFYGEKTFNILGNYKALPTITLTFASLSGATGKIVTLTNPDTGEEISITRDWVNTDVLVVNCFTKTLTVNGTEVDYTGKFLSFEPGTSRKLVYEDNFTGRSVTFGFSYTKRYI